jgi:hypothetical protein
MPKAESIAMFWSAQLYQLLFKPFDDEQNRVSLLLNQSSTFPNQMIVVLLSASPLVEFSNSDDAFDEVMFVIGNEVYAYRTSGCNAVTLIWNWKSGAGPENEIWYPTTHGFPVVFSLLKT